MQVKYTYPYKVSKLTSCFQVVTYPEPSVSFVFVASQSNTLTMKSLMVEVLACLNLCKGSSQTQSTQEEESCCLVFPSSTRREFRHFHVLVVS